MGQKFNVVFLGCRGASIGKVIWWVKKLLLGFLVVEGEPIGKVCDGLRNHCCVSQ